VKKTKSGK